ncbi:MAG: hypothetical protein EOO04_10730 [Chitinophagaceae bacterium]|nr:MAG: hypothetical protein EOO04_10730 [Chitinophagaceae bacterium]
MRKTSIYLIAAMAIAGVTLQSCEKIKDAIFNAFSAQGADVNFVIPAIPDTTTTGTLGSQTAYFDLDSTVKAHTANQFSIDDVNTVSPDSIILTLANADSSNNMSNFESGQLSFYSDANTTPVNFNFTVPDVYATSFVVPVDQSLNLKSYMTGSNYTYTLKGKLRRATTHDLDCNAKIKFKIDD